jgi:hypothetical protein
MSSRLHSAHYNNTVFEAIAMLSAKQDRTGSQLAAQRPVTDSVAGDSHG